MLATSLAGEQRWSVVACDVVLIEFFARPRTQSLSTLWGTPLFVLARRPHSPRAYVVGDRRVSSNDVASECFT